MRDEFRLADLGEERAVNAIIAALGNSFGGGLLDSLDDAAALNLGGITLIKVDGTSEKASRYPWMGLDDLAYRTSANAALDIIAKGGRPQYMLVSIGIPKDRTVKDIQLIGAGLRDFAERYGLKVLGGDLNASDDSLGVWIDVTMLGEAKGLIGMRGAQAGDEVYVTSCLGRSAIPAIIHYLSSRSKDIPVEIKEMLRRPEVPLSFLKHVNEVKVATDVSDGLRSIRRFLRMNSLSLVLTENPPICEDVIELIEELGVSTYDVLKFLGEEYTILYVCREGTSCGDGLLLGSLVDRDIGRVFLNGREVPGGWDNFKGFLTT